MEATSRSLYPTNHWTGSWVDPHYYVQVVEEKHCNVLLTDRTSSAVIDSKNFLRQNRICTSYLLRATWSANRIHIDLSSLVGSNTIMGPRIKKSHEWWKWRPSRILRCCVLYSSANSFWPMSISLKRMSLAKYTMWISLTRTMRNLGHLITALARIPEQFCSNLETEKLLWLMCPVFIPITSGHDGFR
jgi:hypothetical protein